MLILVLLGVYFDAVMVFGTSQTLLFRLALAILWENGVRISQFLPTFSTVFMLTFGEGDQKV